MTTVKRHTALLTRKDVAHDVELLLELSGVLLICQKKKQRRMKMNDEQLKNNMTQLVMQELASHPDHSKKKSKQELLEIFYGKSDDGKTSRSYSVRFPSWVKYAAMRRVIAAIKKQRLKLYTDDYGGSIFHVHPTGEWIIYILRPKGVKSIR